MRATDNLSVFSVELLAIWCALKWVELNKPHISIIYSDSAAALDALSHRASDSRPDLVYYILSCLSRIEKIGSSVMFIWVPGHAGVEGNEVADTLPHYPLQVALQEHS